MADGKIKEKRAETTLVALFVVGFSSSVLFACGHPQTKPPEAIVPKQEEANTAGTAEKSKPPSNASQKRKRRPLVIRQIPPQAPTPKTPGYEPTPLPTAPAIVRPPREKGTSNDSHLGDEELRERLIDSLLKDEAAKSQKTNE